MDPATWHLIEGLVERALELPEDRLRDFLDTCSDQPELRREVESWVKAHREVGDFLEEPPGFEWLEGPRGPTWSVLESLSRPAELPEGPGPVGELLAEYRLEQQIGRGATGTVYRATDTRVGVTVALKTLDWAAPAAIARFKREFRSLADLTHPNLVQLFELRRAGSRWFMTMELIDGPNLIDHLAAEGEGSLTAAGPEGSWLRLRDAFRQLATGLGELHRAGKLHCDIKPGNIRVSPGGRIVLLDFGLIEELVAPHRQDFMGTPAYASPEQLAGETLTPASDWFSVGVMLFEALTGERPFADRGRDAGPPPIAGPLEEKLPQDLIELCRRLLAPRPEDRPVGEEIRGVLGLRPSLGDTLGSSPFVGRRRELESLHDGFERSGEGQPVWIRINGSSGIGKTSLVQHFLRHTVRRAPGTLVLGGRCFSRESVPYACFDELVDDLCRRLSKLPDDERRSLMPEHSWALAGLFPVLGRLAAAPGAVAEEARGERARRRLAVEAFRQLMGRLRRRSRMVLFVDDLQWGDLDSAELLAGLLRPPDPPPLLLITCHRREEAETSPLLRELRRSVTERAALELDLELGPLPSRDARNLAATVLDGRGSEQVSALVKEAGGVPFLLRELASLSGSGCLDVSLRSPEAGPTPLVRLIRRRVADLPADAERLLRIAAVAAQPIAAAEAVAAAELANGGRAQIAQLCIVHLLKVRRHGEGPGASGDRLEVYHDRLREALVESLGADERRHCHARLADALERSGRADAETLAGHFGGAGDGERQVRYLALAAESAARALAFDRAARLYRQTLELVDPRDRAQYRPPLARALANAGRGAAAADVFLEAARDAEEVPEAAEAALDFRFRAAEQQLMSGHYDQGLATMGDVLSAIGVELPNHRWQALVIFCELRLRLAWFRLSGRRIRGGGASPNVLREIDVYRSLAMGLANVRPLAASVCAGLQLNIALRAGEPLRLSRALALMSGFLGIRRQGRRRSRRLLDEARRLAADLGEPTVDGLIDLSEGLRLYLAGEGPEASAQLDRAERALRGHGGVAWEIDTTHFYHFRLLLFLGRLDEVAKRLPAALQECQERGDLYAESCLRSEVACFMHLVADRPDASGAEIERVETAWSDTGYHLQHYLCLGGRVGEAIYRGRGLAAWEMASGGWPEMRKSALLGIDLVRLQAINNLKCRTALAAATESEDPRERRRFVGQVRGALRSLGRIRHPWAGPLRLLDHAACQHLTGSPEKARRLLEKSIDDLGSIHFELHAAAARWHLGGLQGKRGFSLRRDAERWMGDQGVVNPGRLAHLLAPGFPTDSS